MDWCCNSARNRFEARHSYGEFLVAGHHPGVNGDRFFVGFFERRAWEEASRAAGAAP